MPEESRLGKSTQARQEIREFLPRGKPDFTGLPDV
jgi:hypothetical protein